MESAFVSVRTKKLTNRGFLRGPFLPIYGSGAIMMLVVSIPFRGNIFLTFLSGCVGATALEYVTGVAMEALFKVRYWDYSDKPFNFQGHICLGTTLAWGCLTVLMTEFIHVPVERLALSIPDQALTVLTLLLTAAILADFVLSVKAALDLRSILAGMGRVKKELLNIQKSLDAIITRAEEAVENRKNALAEGIAARKDEFAGSMSELKAGIEGRLERIKKLMQTRSDGCLEDSGEEISRLRERYSANLELGGRMGRLKAAFRKVFRSNPSITSVEFREELEELKEHAGTWSRRRKKGGDDS